MVAAAPGRCGNGDRTRFAQTLALRSRVVERQAETRAACIRLSGPYRVVTVVGAAAVTGTHPRPVDVLTAQHSERQDSEAKEMAQDDQTE